MNPAIELVQLSKGDPIAVLYNEEDDYVVGIVEYVENGGRDDTFTPYHIRVNWLNDIISSNPVALPYFICDSSIIVALTREDFLEIVEDVKFRISADIEKLLNIAS